MKPGIYNIPNHEYHHQTPYKFMLSKGGLDRLESSPAHFKVQQTGGGPPTKEMNFGGAFHLFCLENDTFNDCVDVRKSVKVADRNGYAADGLHLITQDEEDTMWGMRKALMKHPAASALLNHPNAEFEHTVLWKDLEHDFWCKCKPDISISGLDIIADLKTCQDASRASFAKACANYNYHFQAAHYLEGANWFNYGPMAFVFIAIEKTPPYGVAVYRATDEFIESGRRRIKPLKATYAECLKTDAWPAYPERIQDLDLPGWARHALSITGA